METTQAAETTSSKARHPEGERWEIGFGDGAGVYLKSEGRSGHLKIGDFSCGGRAPGGSAAAVGRALLAASAPTMRAKLDRAASDLAEIEVALEFVRTRLADDEVSADDLTALDHIREALAALRSNVEAR